MPDVNADATTDWAQAITDAPDLHTAVDLYAGLRIRGAIYHEPLEQQRASDAIYGRICATTPPIMNVGVYDCIGNQIAVVQGCSVPDVVTYWQERRPRTPDEVKYGDIAYLGCREGICGGLDPETATGAEIRSGLGNRGPLELQFMVVD